MKLTMYGTDLCRHCQEAKALFNERGIDYKMIDITESIANLREFLTIRDESPLFDEVKKENRVGIPCLKDEDSGRISLNPKDFL